MSWIRLFRYLGCVFKLIFQRNISKFIYENSKLLFLFFIFPGLCQHYLLGQGYNKTIAQNKRQKNQLWVFIILKIFGKIWSVSLDNWLQHISQISEESHLWPKAKNKLHTKIFILALHFSFQNPSYNVAISKDPEFIIDHDSIDSVA